MENEIYVICWFDGDKAFAMAGTRTSKGLISPLAVERRELRPGTMTDGVISINEDSRQAVNTLVRCVANLLTTNLNDTYVVRAIYLVVMPRSMRSVSTFGEKTFVTKAYVTDSDVLECHDLAMKNASANASVITLYDNGYLIDGSNARHAVGEIAKKLRLNALAVISDRRFSSDYNVLAPQGVTLAGVIPASVAASMAVTTPDERLNGVVSVHFCSTATLFTAYSDDRVLATCVVPFGENDVIHDLRDALASVAQDGVWQEVYDRWDFVVRDSSTPDSSFVVSGIDADRVDHARYFAELRINEICRLGFEWLRTQVRDFDTLVKKAVFSGAVSDKRGFAKFATSLAPTCECRCANANGIISECTYHDDSDFIPMVGAMLLATRNCAEVKPSTPSLEQMQRQEEERRRLEAERKRQEEEERKRLEDEKNKKKNAKDAFRTLFGLSDNRNL